MVRPLTLFVALGTSRGASSGHNLPQFVSDRLELLTDSGKTAYCTTENFDLTARKTMEHGLHSDGGLIRFFRGGVISSCKC